jgi:hypothetical protein
MPAVRVCIRYSWLWRTGTELREFGRACLALQGKDYSLRRCCPSGIKNCTSASIYDKRGQLAMVGVFLIKAAPPGLDGRNTEILNASGLFWIIQ